VRRSEGSGEREMGSEGCGVRGGWGRETRGEEEKVRGKGSNHASTKTNH